MSRRVLLGHFPDGGYGLRVSQPSVDVRTLSPASVPGDNERLVFSSDWFATLPIMLSGLATVAANTTRTIPFPSVGYFPFCNVMARIPSSISGPFAPYSGLLTYSPSGGLGCYTLQNAFVIVNSYGVPVDVGYKIYRLKAF